MEMISEQETWKGEEDKTEKEWLTNETGFRWHRSLGDWTGTFPLNMCTIYT